MEYYKLIIDQTAKDSPKETEREGDCFNRLTREFDTYEELNEWLYQTYEIKDMLDKDYRGVYIDDENGKTKKICILYSYWNKYCSHNSKIWWQTDWIVAYKVEEKRTYLVD